MRTALCVMCRIALCYARHCTACAALLGTMRAALHRIVPIPPRCTPLGATANNVLQRYWCSTAMVPFVTKA